ncbi:MAG TPA: long-chain fatty acid--CoA ligase [Turneriella sp.]|nr:long-chain fatty acid--CoA ligase [Turneriella sp.]
MSIKPDPKSIPRPWVKHYDKHVPETMEYSSKSLPELFEESAKEHATRVGVKFLGKSICYAEIEKSATAFAAFLEAKGIGKGDRVFLMLPNSPHFIVAYYAALKRGAIVVPASPLDTASEAEYKFKNSGAKVIVYLDLLHSKLSDLLQKDTTTPTVVCDVADYLSAVKRFFFRLKKATLKIPLPDGKRTASVKYKKVLKEFNDKTPTKIVVKNSEPAVIIYTGGTTGVSKGVVLSHYAMVVNMTQAKNWGDLTLDDVGLCVLPFFHGFGMSVGLNVSLSSGGTMVLMPRWDAGQAIKHFEKDGITVYAGVPTMYNAMLNHKNFAKMKNAKLRGCFVGAAPVPEALKVAFKEKTGGTLIEGYGLTESVTAKCANPYHGLKKEKSIGIPWPDTLMAIVDDTTGELLPPGKDGEIILHSPDLMLGYWQNEEATRATIKNGWLYTGDIGRMDEDGYFAIVDRKKDLIISGGYNVYPAEVEDVLYKHPAVLEACVVGTKDDHLGEVGRAFIALKEGMSVSADELKNFLIDKLIKYKIPKEFVFRKELPKSPVGKILRKELRKES